jgi:hypothetical protein
VALARALACTDPNGRPAPGWVTVIIVPLSQDPRPTPSVVLLRKVQEFLEARAPSTLSGVYVAGPSYLAVGVDAVVAPRESSAAGPVATACRQALATFLHPLAGGPTGQGWSFGRNVYLSDVAAVLENVPGVDYISTLELLIDGISQGEVVTVPADHIVAAGPSRIRMVAGGG